MLGRMHAKENQESISKGKEALLDPRFSDKKNDKKKKGAVVKKEKGKNVVDVIFFYEVIFTKFK
jgi:hypothetical protein